MTRLTDNGCLQTVPRQFSGTFNQHVQLIDHLMNSQHVATTAANGKCQFKLCLLSPLLYTVFQLFIFECLNNKSNDFCYGSATLLGLKRKEKKTHLLKKKQKFIIISSLFLTIQLHKMQPTIQTNEICAVNASSVENTGLY